jgi:hypothetical protein
MSRYSVAYDGQMPLTGRTPNEIAKASFGPSARFIARDDEPGMVGVIAEPSPAMYLERGSHTTEWDVLAWVVDVHEIGEGRDAR